MVVEWPYESVNNDFYGMTRVNDENIISTRFESGKERYTLKNSSPKLTISVMLDIHSKAEELAFWKWYTDTLKSRTETILLSDFLGSGIDKEYRMIDEPSAEGQNPRIFTFTFREE